MRFLRFPLSSNRKSRPEVAKMTVRVITGQEDVFQNDTLVFRSVSFELGLLSVFIHPGTTRAQDGGEQTADMMCW